MNHWGASKEPFLFLTDFELKRIVLIPENELGQSPVRFVIQSANACPTYRNSNAKEDLQLSPVSFSTYQQGFDLVKQHIHHGNSYLLNLTYPSKIETELSLEDIYCRSSAEYKLIWKDKFTVFSPESFVRIKNNHIYSHPMKGTIDAEFPDARNALLNDTKELAEHYTIVDLIRNDLNLVATAVEVKRFRYFDMVQSKDKKLYQTSSEISGKLADNWRENLGDILFKLLPAGSVSGAPKPKTLEIIKEAELDERGYYTGVFGFYDGDSLDSGVMIRFIELKKGQMFYRSGGGITSKSDCKMEYEELKNKIYVPII
jgi:para-aminobenzoate synthetase component 1